MGLIDCFVSYSRKDSAVADAMVRMLTDNGVRCWVDRTDSVAGLDYAASIVRAIKSSGIFILLISASSLRSRHVLSELNTAVGSDSVVIPVNLDGSPLNDAMEYYLGRTQWIDGTSGTDNWYRRLLEAIRSARIEEDRSSEEMRTAGEERSPYAGPDTSGGADKHVCRMLRYQDLLDLGYTSKRIAMKLVENDYINFNGLADENEGTPDQWEVYLRDESETFRYLVNGRNEIVGDWSLIALTDEAQKKAEAGELMECEVSIDTTVKICIPGVYHGFILSCSALPAYRTQKNYLLLLSSLFEQMEEYAENGVFFDGWLINVFNTDGESLMRSLGFRHVADNRKSGKIYYLPFIPYPDHPYLKSFQRLAALYESHQ